MESPCSSLVTSSLPWAQGFVTNDVPFSGGFWFSSSPPPYTYLQSGSSTTVSALQSPVWAGTPTTALQIRLRPASYRLSKRIGPI